MPVPMLSLNLLQARQERHRDIAADVITLPKHLMHGPVSTGSCVRLKHALTDQDLQFESVLILKDLAYVN